MLNVLMMFGAFLSLDRSSCSSTPTSVISAISVAVSACTSDVPLGRRFSATVLALRWMTWASSFTTVQPCGASTRRRDVLGQQLGVVAAPGGQHDLLVGLAERRECAQRAEAGGGSSSLEDTAPADMRLHRFVAHGSSLFGFVDVARLKSFAAPPSSGSTTAALGWPAHVDPVAFLRQRTVGAVGQVDHDAVGARDAHMHVDRRAEIGNQLDRAAQPVVETRRGRAQRQALRPQRDHAGAERAVDGRRSRRRASVSNRPGPMTRPGQQIAAPDEAGDEAIGGALVEVALRADLAHRALGHHDQAVGHDQRFFLVVRHHHRRDAELVAAARGSRHAPSRAAWRPGSTAARRAAALRAG